MSIRFKKTQVRTHSVIKSCNTLGYLIKSRSVRSKNVEVVKRFRAIISRITVEFCFIPKRKEAVSRHAIVPLIS